MVHCTNIFCAVVPVSMIPPDGPRDLKCGGLYFHDTTRCVKRSKRYSKMGGTIHSCVICWGFANPLGRCFGERQIFKSIVYFCLHWVISGNAKRLWVILYKHFWHCRKRNRQNFKEIGQGSSSGGDPLIFENVIRTSKRFIYGDNRP